MSVDEAFDIPKGLVLLTCTDGVIPLDVESYVEAKQIIANEQGVAAAEVSLVGLTFSFNEEDVPVVHETD